MTHKQLEAFILKLEGTWLDYPFGKDAAVYKVGLKENPSTDGASTFDANSGGSTSSGQGKMFAIISETSHPVRISLKCDPELAVTLRQKYETVLPGYHLNKKHWNTIICSGQLGEAETFDLIRHSYELVTA